MQCWEVWHPVFKGFKGPRYETSTLLRLEMCRFMRCGLKKKIFLPQSLRKEVASVQEGLSGAAVLSTTSSTPGSTPLTSSSTFCLPLLVIPTSGFNPSGDFRRKLRINNKSPLSAPFFSSRYIVLLISRQSGMTDAVSVNSATGLLLCFVFSLVLFLIH